MSEDAPIELTSDDLASPAPDAPAIPYNPLFAIREDNGPFLPFGSYFSSNKARWFGPVVASSTAVYFLKKRKMNSSYGGGLVDNLLASAFSKEDYIATCTVDDLPPVIRKQLDPKNKLAKKPVIIVPRSTVSKITPKRMGNSLIISVGLDNFTLSARMFRYSSTLKKFNNLGWPFNTDLTPTDAPVHDARTDEERANPVQKPLWQRILMAAAAILIVLAYIALRILAHR